MNWEREVINVLGDFHTQALDWYQFQETQKTCYSVLPLSVGPYQDQVINRLLAHFLLTVGPVGPQTYLVVISPVLKWKSMIICYNLI